MNLESFGGVRYAVPFHCPASAAERRTKITTGGISDRLSLGQVYAAELLVSTALVVKTAGCYFETETM